MTDKHRGQLKRRETALTSKGGGDTYLKVLLKECILPASMDTSSCELLLAVDPAGKLLAIGFFTYGGSYFGPVLFFLTQACGGNVPLRSIDYVSQNNTDLSVVGIENTFATSGFSFPRGGLIGI